MIDENFQDMVLACMLKLPEFNAVAAHHLKPDYFDGPVRKNLCKMFCDFWLTYDTPVSDRVLVSLLKDLSEKEVISKHDIMPHGKKYKELKGISISEWKYVLDKLVSFIKHQKIKLLIEDSVKKHLPKGKYDVIEQEMAKIAGINAMNRVQAYDYFNAETIIERGKAREKELKEGKISISTGIKLLDDGMHAGGFYKKELYIFLGSPKRGKSMSLLWFSNQAALQGYNVAHFSCEVSGEVCSTRLDAMNSKTPIKEVTRQHEAVASHMAAKIPRGKLFLFEYPTKALTLQMIDEQVDKLRTEHGVTIDMLVVDYLDIMKYNGTAGDSAWSEQKPLAEGLRGLAGKYIVPCVTASQINRQGSGKAVNSGKDVAGNYEKIMVADEIYTLSCTDEELKENILRISNTESRNSEGGTIVISTKFNYGQFYSDTVGTEL